MASDLAERVKEGELAPAVQEKPHKAGNCGKPGLTTRLQAVNININQAKLPSWANVLIFARTLLDFLNSQFPRYFMTFYFGRTLYI